MSVIDAASSLFKSVTAVPRKIFGTRNDRLLKAYRLRIQPIGALEEEIRGDYDAAFASRTASLPLDDLSDEEREIALYNIRYELSAPLRERAQSLRERISPLMQPLDDWWRALSPTQQVDDYYKKEYHPRHGKVVDAMDREGISAEAFAVLREASRRAQNHRHFDCQLIGGRVLFEGKIAEMKTGEGKTIVCHLAAFLRVVSGHKVHVVTVNDYLVKRDAEFAKPIFGLLDISVGHIQSQLDPAGREGVRKAAYGSDICYGTNSEFGFDYLRDNMKLRLEEQVQGRLDYVIVDEVDSILIDEARTPLIISGPAHDDVTRYPRADTVSRELVKRQVTWDRKVLATVAKFDGDTRGIPKLEDAMNILGHRERKSTKDKKDKKSKKNAAPNDDSNNDANAESTADDEQPTLGADFLTDDHVEAIQIFENDVLELAPQEQYRKYFIVQQERKQVGITHDGVTIAQELLDLGSLYSGANMEWPHLIENALRAHKVYQRDKDYVVQDGAIVIVDPFTGRLMIGRQWSDGLHQAIEAKEHVRVKEETQTLATITIQNFIKLYLIKAGMTGTALTEANEFDKIYNLDVLEIPTNRPVNRVDHNDKMYRDVDQKYDAIVDEIHEVHRRGRPADPFLLADVLTAMKGVFSKQGVNTDRIDEAIQRFNNAEIGDTKTIQFMLDVYDEMMGDLARGRPVLVGTTSVENSEKLARLLDRRYGIDHEVLNAKNHEREADIVAKAGFATTPTRGPDRTPRGNVTIATNMAGRGTDIKLGPGVVYEKCRVPATLPEGVSASPLFPVGITKCCITCDEYDPATNCAHCFKPKLDPRFPELGRKVCPIIVPCGLHIIATERHESRRIDNQLRGRSGRQGDPGSSRFSLSLQDDLLKLFMPDWMLKMMEKLGFTDGSSLEDKRLTKGIERAQRKVEERNFSTRKHLLEWDEPMDYQRKEFYSARQRILEERDLPELIFNTIDNSIRTTLDHYLDPDYARKAIAEWCRINLEVTIEEDRIDTDDLESAHHSIREKAIDEANDAIRTSIGEYIDPEEPASAWDVGGLLTWARRAYNFSMTQNQMRKMQPSELEDALLDAARQHFQEVDLEAVAVFLDPQHPQRSLAEWGRTKFAIELDVEELVGKNADEVAEVLEERVRNAYREREVTYPVESCVDRAFRTEGVSPAETAQAIAGWANTKFNVDWSPEDVLGKQAAEVRDSLIEVSRSFFDGKLQSEIDRSVDGKSHDDAVAWAKKRFGRAWNQQRFEQFNTDRSNAEQSNGAQSNGDLNAALFEQGREMLRWELTRLEQFVLLRIYDQAWKDHLLEMDHLKTAIMQRPLGGDQTHPQSQFAIEGRDLFRGMWERIAARVTDIVFKISATPEGTSGEETPSRVAMGHADATGAGFASADQAAAMRAQGSDGKVETIRREQPRVGRNEPCPCGSGKKYKQCHGKGKG